MGGRGEMVSERYLYARWPAKYLPRGIEASWGECRDWALPTGDLLGMR